MTLKDRGNIKRAWLRSGTVAVGGGGYCLNLGSGHDYRPGWSNVDLHREADIRQDLWAESWDLTHDSYLLALARDLLEHAPPRLHGRDGVVHVLKETARHMAPGGLLLVAVPYAGSRDASKNVDHYHTFNRDTLPHLLGALGPRDRHPNPPPFDLLGQRVLRRLQVAGLDSWYHGEKYLGRKLTQVGRPARIRAVLRRHHRPGWRP